MPENLFGEEQGYPNKVRNIVLGYVQKWKITNNYHRSKHPYRKCDNCHYCRVKNYHNKRYYKCSQLGISGSVATDIRLRSICDLWTPETPEEYK